MGKPFKLTILSDFGELLRGTKDAGDGFEELADTLDDVARDGDDAADKLEKSFKASLDSVRKEAGTTGKAMGDDLRDGTRKAGEGMSELKDEAASTAREAAASFDGSAESISDVFQEVAANAFAGFGPAGAVAGLAVAAGIGLAVTAMQGYAEEVTAAKESTLDLADELADVGNDPGALDWAARLRDRMKEITDNREWFEFWQDAPRTRFEEWSEAAEKYGVNMSDVTRAVTGDQRALDAVMGELNRRIGEQEAAALAAAQATGDMGIAAVDGAGPMREFRDAVAEEASMVSEAVEFNRSLAGAIGEVSDAATDSAAITEDYRAAVADSLTGAGESWQQYTKNGKVNLAEYNKAIEEQAKAVEQFEVNVVTASRNLSQEALDYVRSLGPEAAPLLQSFVDAPLAQQERTARNWDMLGRAATDGYRESVQLESVTARALEGAQRTATNSPIRFGTTLNSAGIGQAVATLAQTASNNAPPVVLRTIMRERVV